MCADLTALTRDALDQRADTRGVTEWQLPVEIKQKSETASPIAVCVALLP